MAGPMNWAMKFEVCGNVSIKIERQGLFDTLQDEGRKDKGLRGFGVPTGGWFDPYHARLANALLNNDLNAPCLEITQISGLFRLQSRLQLAIVGPGAIIEIQTDKNDITTYKESVMLNLMAGASVTVRHTGAGLRSYLAVAGGWQGRPTLSSISSETPLIKGDYIIAGEPVRLVPNGPVCQLNPTLMRPTTRTETLPFIVSHEFARACKNHGRLEEAFSGWKMLTQSNRVGLRFEGPLVSILREDWPLDPERLSQPVMPGTIQWTGSELILLGVAGGTMGGYPTLGQLAAVALPRMAQLTPGSEIKLKYVTVDEARNAWIQDQQQASRTWSRIRAISTSK